MKAAFVVTFTSAVPGREVQAIDYAREVDDFWGKQAAEGRCSEPEWFWASRGPSFWVVKGEMEQLLVLMNSPEAQRLIHKGQLVVRDFEYDLYMYGREENLKAYEAGVKDVLHV